MVSKDSSFILNSDVQYAINQGPVRRSTSRDSPPREERSSCC